MLKIRLQRVGRTNIPVFRVVLTDSTNSTKSGRYLEVLGSYNPVTKLKEIKADRIKHWISKGAQLSGTVHNFLIDKKVIAGKKLNVLPKKKPIIKEKAEAPAEAPKVESPKELESKEAAKTEIPAA